MQVLGMTTKKRYSDLKKFSTYEERFEYLKLDGSIGADTFGFDRYLNQALYKSKEWQDARRSVILRDNGRDLGVEDMLIPGKIFIHHINPITQDDIINRSDSLFDPENLICVSHETHNALHYGSERPKRGIITKRSINDTIPWRN